MIRKYKYTPTSRFVKQYALQIGLYNIRSLMSRLFTTFSEYFSSVLCVAGIFGVSANRSGLEYISKHVFTHKLL